MTTHRTWPLLVWFVLPLVALGQESSITLETLRQLDTRVLEDTPEAQRAAREAVRLDARSRIRAVNQRETANWRQLKSREEWEKYRDARVKSLKDSLGMSAFSDVPLNTRVTRRIEGDGYRIHNLVYTSRPGVLVAANLYLPAKPVDSMPGIIICHSHHAPKHQGELQTMGVTWAKHGAAVLVMDQLGHGERRTHRFATADSYPGSFRPERQDYYFRYNTGVQLQLLGESLLGWMVGDMRRGVDVLLEQPGIDKERIILLGAVAGGGDPAAVAAALDPRIRCAVPFNFGGCEPEDVFPLPEDAEETFNFAGGGDWESTRNLAFSARDGFQPWVTIGAVAPRSLIYAHEFRWDEPRDPVWKRLKQIYAWYDASDRLSSVVGKGNVKWKAPDASHCTNIGSLHRSQIYPSLERWFQMPIPQEPTFERYTSEQLRCFTDEIDVPKWEDVLQQVADDRSANRSVLLTTEWRPLRMEVSSEINVTSNILSTARQGDISVEKIRLNLAGTQTTIPLSLILLRPAKIAEPKRIVVAVSQKGKAAFLTERTEAIKALLDAGAVVVLADLRGTGESEPQGEGRGRQSGATGRSSSEWMLGRTTLGLRVRDVNTILAYLRKRSDLHGGDFGVWGEGFVAANAADRDLAVPLDAEKLPLQSEPMAMLVAVLTSMSADDVRTVYAAGGLTSYRSVLEQPYFYVPHDCLIPGMLVADDIPEWIASAAANNHVRLVDLRDGLNRRVVSGPGSEPPLDPVSISQWLLKK